MKCLQCGSKELDYDELSNMYFCPKCNRLYSESEVELDDELLVDDTSSASKAKEWEAEELNGFSLIVLNILQSIPIIGILIPIVVTNANVKESDKRHFGYRFLAQLFSVLICVVLLTIVMYSYKIDYGEALQQGMNNIIEFFMPRFKSNAITSIPSMDSITIDETLPDEDSTEDIPVLSQDNWNLVDGVVMNGKQVMNIINKTEGCQVAYLVQTTGISERHGEDTYINVGYVLDGFDKDTSKSTVYYIEAKAAYELYTDDYGEYVYEEIDTIKNSKYIFYVNPKDNYVMNVLYDSNNLVIGFMFTEVEN